MVDFASHRDVKSTRSDHNCAGCGCTIPSGSPAFYFSGKFEGHFSSCHYHTDCRDAEVALNDLRQTLGGEWDCIGEIAEEPEDVEWLIETFPSVAARLQLLPTGED